MNKKFNKFLIVGLVACSTAFVADKIINQPSVAEYGNMLTSVIKQEELNVLPKISKGYGYESFANFKLSKEGSKSVDLKLGIISTNVLKIMAPISALNAKTSGVYDFIALHEYSHGQFNYLMQNEKDFFNLKIDGFSNKDTEKIDEQFKQYFKEKHKSPLTANLHENFADAYASVLMIRTLSDKYSDDEIKKIITYRHNQVKNQNEFLFGAFGDLEHRTDLAIKKVLDTSFEDIRAMSPNVAQEFTVKIASASNVEKFSNIYKQLIEKNFILEEVSQKSLNNFAIKDQASALLSMKKIRDLSLEKKVSYSSFNKKI